MTTDLLLLPPTSPGATENLAGNGVTATANTPEPIAGAAHCIDIARLAGNFRPIPLKTALPFPHPGHHRPALARNKLPGVIAIISILASLLLPAFDRAPLKANIIECVFRFRQLGLEVMLPSGDYNSFFQCPTPAVN